MKFFTPLVLFAATSAASSGNGLTSQQVEKITKNTDNLMKQLGKTCPDLPSKCVAPLKALIGDLGDAASHDDINAIQRSALNFVEGLKSTPECLSSTIQCVASIQKKME